MSRVAVHGHTCGMPSTITVELRAVRPRRRWRNRSIHNGLYWRGARLTPFNVVDRPVNLSVSGPGWARRLQVMMRGDQRAADGRRAPSHRPAARSQRRRGSRRSAAYREVVREGSGAAASRPCSGSPPWRGSTERAPALVSETGGARRRGRRRGRVHGGEQLVVEGLGLGDSVEDLHAVAPGRTRSRCRRPPMRRSAERTVDHRVLDPVERDGLRGPREGCRPP